MHQCYQTKDHRINRIRLEFKEASQATGITYAVEVLIESDWNLKLFFIRYYTDSENSINRIRLEFKGSSG